MFKLVYACVSDVGTVRSENQDNYICGKQYLKTGEVQSSPVFGSCVLRTPFLTAVFDGMGGEERGEMASLIAAETAAETDLSQETITALMGFIRNANRRICDFAKTNNIRSTGTTAAMLLYTPDTVYMLNVGDSPVYLLSDRRLVKISVDDVSVPIAGHKPPLTQNLGIPEDEMTIEPHLFRLALKKGDRYLISSDGLTDMVSEERIAEILSKTPIQEASVALMQEALRNGGRDNVTVIAAEIQKARLSLKGWV